MQCRKFVKTILIIMTLFVMIFSAAHSLAEYDNEQENENQEKSETERVGEEVRGIPQKQLEAVKKEVAPPAINAAQPAVVSQTEQAIAEKAPVDSDGDFVPDEFDEHPGEDDFSYLIDSDKDGIADALDKHPGENDAAYAVSDINENGIVDAVENLANNPQ